MSDDLDFYDLLGVSEEASQEEIRKGFRTQVREYHPDLNDDPRAPAQFTALKKAYETLRDEKERDAYDRMGHHEYVTSRISGLPSPEDWNVPERIDRDERNGGAATGTDRGPTVDGSSGTDGPRSNGSASARSGGASRSGDGTAEGPAGSAPGETGGSSVEGGASAAARSGTDSTNSRTSSTTSQSRSSTRSGESGGASLGHQPSVEGGPSRSLGPERRPGAGEDAEADAGSAPRGTRTGAGTARDPGSVWTGSDDGGSGTATGMGEATAVEESTPVVQRLRSGVDALVSATIGWPLIVAADVLFVATLGLYAAENAGGLARFADALGAAGLDVEALRAALATRPEGMEPFADFLVAQLAANPMLGTVALVGLAFLPSVYFFMIRWTRKNRLPWQPSYLYVVGALAPTLGLVLSATGTVSGVYVEVFLLGVVPGATIFAMLFFGQIKPRFERTVRAWRYRRKG